MSSEAGRLHAFETNRTSRHELDTRAQHKTKNAIGAARVKIQASELLTRKEPDQKCGKLAGLVVQWIESGYQRQRGVTEGRIVCQRAP